MSIQPVNKAVEHLINSTPVLGEERERELNWKKHFTGEGGRGRKRERDRIGKLRERERERERTRTRTRTRKLYFARIVVQVQSKTCLTTGPC